MPTLMSSARNIHLFLHLSNRLENLAECLATQLASSRADPMTSRAIVVSSADTARWLGMQIATHRGLAMGLRFPFLRGTIDELATAMLGGQRRCSTRYGRDALTWWLYDRLPEFLAHPRFALVAAYLQGGTVKRRFELARRVASLFDQYQIYRPSMLRDWDCNVHAGEWQGDLWRVLRKDLQGEESFVDLHAAILEMPSSALECAQLPERLDIFGLNTLPPAFLDVLHKVAAKTRIDFYLLSPTDQYWSDLLTEKQRLKGASADTPREGNPLANSLGKLGRELLDQLLARDIQQASEDFRPSSAEGVLGSLQDDLLELRDRTQDVHHQQIAANDRSVEVHSCHSRLREIETLYDDLLGLFDENPKLRPRDVLVMAPDIEAYAPYIRAVFGTPETEASRIPYSLADQSSRNRIVAVDAFLRVLELGLSNFGNAQVFGVLESGPIRARFGLTERDLVRIRHWVDDCGIVRGLDAEHRARLGLEKSAEFSWDRGESTWLLGYAMNGDGSRLCGELQPYADMEGDHLDTLDRLLATLDFLRGVARDLQTPQPRRQWSVLLLRTLRQLFGPEPDVESRLRVLHDALLELADSDPLQRDEPVAAEVILDSLDHRLRESAMTGGFLDGRVTFCSLKPMRAIPASIVCLLGMTEQDFPRQGSRLTFDLLAIDPQRGDRSLRDDDRYLFLEALLSARQRLRISHVGQSQHDASQAQPSVVVVELIDYLRRSFESGKSIDDTVRVRHPLQAFSGRCFDPGVHQSFSGDNAAAATALAAGGSVPHRLFPKPLPEPGVEWRRLTPARLVDFFVHPARRICEWRLGIRIGHDPAQLRAHEPLELDSLENYLLRQSRLEAMLRGDDTPVFEVARARGQLPPGAFGVATAEDIDRATSRLLAGVGPYISDKPRSKLHVDWRQGHWTVEGEIDGLYGNALCRFRSASLKAKDLIAAWIEHLLVNLVEPGRRTVLVDRDGTVQTLRPPHTTRETELLVHQLLELYWQGLQRPLHFFPETSAAYARSLTSKKPRTPEAALRAAGREWLGDQFGFSGESENPWNALVYSGLSPLDAEFAALAMNFFAPLHTHLEEPEE